MSLFFKRLGLFFSLLALPVFFSAACSNRQAQVQVVQDDNPFPNFPPPGNEDPPLPDLEVSLAGRIAGSGAYSQDNLTVDFNSDIQLKWVILGSPDNCQQTNIGTNVLDSLAKNFNGLTSTTTFSITCSRGDEEVSDSLVVTVRPEPEVLIPHIKAQASLPFGSVQTNSDKTLFIELENDGEILASDITPIFLGTGANPFSIVSGADECGDNDLPIGAKCKLHIKFDPDNEEAYTRFLKVEYTSGGFLLDFEVEIKGTGTIPPAPYGLDRSFSVDGKVINGLLGNAMHSAIQRVSNVDKIVILGTGRVGGATVDSLALVRLNPNGSIDSSFGSNGRVITPSSDHVIPKRLIVLPDGKILASGMTDINRGTNNGGHTARVVIARYNVNGSLDTSFGSGGLIDDNVGGINTASLRGMAVDSQGRIVAVSYLMSAGRVLSQHGTAGSGAILSRYTVNGQRDTSFGNGGWSYMEFATFGGRYSMPNHVAVQSNGTILVAGRAHCDSSTGYKLAIAKATANGIYLGTTCTGLEYRRGYTSIFVNDDDSFVAVGDAGETHYETWVTRFRADASELSSKSFSFGTQNSAPVHADQLPNGNVLITGISQDKANYAAIVNPATGATVKSFKAAAFTNTRVYGGLVQPDGKVFLYGGIINGLVQMRLMRFLP